MNNGLEDYDPDCLLTGEEMVQGYSYKNSKREYPNEDTRLAALRGEISPTELVKVAPRKFINPIYAHTDERTI